MTSLYKLKIAAEKLEALLVAIDAIDKATLAMQPINQNIDEILAIPPQVEVVKELSNTAIIKANEATSSADIALEALNDFKGRYFQGLAKDPTLDLLGNPLNAGDMYFNTVENEIKVYSGTSWDKIGTKVNGTTKRETFVATGGETSFVISGGYDASFVDVYQNGIKLLNNVDVDVSSEDNIILTLPANAGDKIDIVAYGTFKLADMYSISTIDNITLTQAINNINIAQALGVQKSKNKNSFSRVGELVKTTGAKPFVDCIKANGSLLRRDEFPELWEFAKDSENICTEEKWSKNQFLSYSYGDGVSTFRVPDWRGQFERAWDDGKGIDINRQIGAAQADMFKSHSHEQKDLGWRGVFQSGADRAGWYWDDDAENYSHPHKMITGGNETRPINGAILYCIKYTNRR